MNYPRSYSGIYNIQSPSLDYFQVTPSNTVNFAYTAKSLRVGTGGDVVAIRDDDVAVTFKNVSSGEILPIVCKRVNATGTTASDIVGL